MLTTKEEIECVKEAWEMGIRDPQRPRHHFQDILDSFFNKYSFQNKRWLDLGPGHYDFGELVRKKGGKTTSIELDPAVIKLGQIKSLEVIKGDLGSKGVFESLSNQYDGLFCRGSINAMNFPNVEDHEAFLEAMISTVKSTGAMWVSPCNDSSIESDPQFESTVQFQIDFFQRNGFKIIKCTPVMVSTFGIWSTKPELIFTKNLDFSLDKIQRQLNIKRITRDLPGRLYRKLNFKK